MWKHILFPIVLIVLFWLAVSIPTTVYLAYADREYNRVLTENVATIGPASDVQVACWKLYVAQSNSDTNPDQDNNGWARQSKVLSKAIDHVRTLALTPHEQTVLQDIDVHMVAVDGLVQQLDGQTTATVDDKQSAALVSQLRAHLEKIASLAYDIREHNERLIASAEVERRRLLARIMVARNAGLVVGPLIGIALGWIIAHRLQRRISTLAITLRNAPSEQDVHVVEYTLNGADDLSVVQILSEEVVQRMQKIVSELSRAEQEVIQSEKLAAVGEIAAGVAHELRNPLTSIKLLLQHAANKQDSGLIEVNNLNLILSEIGRMEDSIQGLLDFSRPSGLHFRIHDIHIPLQRAITLVRGRAITSDVEIQYRPASGPVLVNADIEQMHLVFVNLLINSIESIVSRGTIVVEVSPDHGTKRTVCVRIRDSGAGISPEIMQRLFMPFASDKKKGTGLGLALSQRIVDGHHGRIAAVNQAEGGTLFIIELPLAGMSPEIDLSSSDLNLVESGISTCH